MGYWQHITSVKGFLKFFLPAFQKCFKWAIGSTLHLSNVDAAAVGSYRIKGFFKLIFFASFSKVFLMDLSKVDAAAVGSYRETALNGL